MLSPNVEVQCNAVGCVTNLATHGKQLPPFLFYTSDLPAMDRRQQDEDRKVRCACASHSACKIKRYACAAQCYWCALEHDPFWYAEASCSLGLQLTYRYTDENRQQLVNAGAIPVLVSLLNSPDTDVQYYCTTALSNIAVDGTNRKKLAQSEPKLVTSLVMLMDSSSLKVQCQAALALRNLASDGKGVPS